MMVFDPALAPLSRWTDAVLLVARLITGVARDLKACNDESGLGYVGRLQFRKCMDPRGHAVTSRD